jgi:arabinose-5-phosphate isomerase
MPIVSSISENALETIRLQADSITGLQQYINSDFTRAVETILQCNGRVVVSGIGKSAVIAQKITATFNSTGTPALFMHAADAIHGDLGMVQPGDVTIVISKSGNSPEIKVLVPLIKHFGNVVIAICGNTESYLAKQADLLLNTTVAKEACPHNLAPTTSTTAQLVMGDALAVCLLKQRGFTEADFAKYHPGGVLGKRLYLRVSDLIDANAKPQVAMSAGLKAIIVEISKSRLGATAVLAQDGSLAGIVTDGDLRRMLEKHEDPFALTAADIRTQQPVTIEASALATDALLIMQRQNISQLVVLQQGSYAGMVHLHDIVREGII